jgi:hypothetical protein
VGLELFGDIHDEKRDNKDFEDCLLHPNKDTVSRFFKRPMEAGSCVIEVLSACNSFKAIIFSNNSGSLSSFKQPDKLRI